MSQDVPRILFAKQLAEIQAGCTVLVPRLSQEDMDKYISRNPVRKSKLRPIGPNFYQLDDSDEDEGDDVQVEITQERDKPIRTISLMDSDDDDDNEPEVIPMRPPERNSAIESHSTIVQSFSCSSKTTTPTSVEALVENPPPSVISEPVHSDTTPAVQDENNETVVRDENNETVVRDENNETVESASQSEAREASKEKSIAVSETAVVVVNSNEITTQSKSCENPEESNSFSTCIVAASVEATNAVSSSEPVPAENIRKKSVIKSLSELCTTSIETHIPSGSSSSKISTEKAPDENNEKDTISSRSEARETPNETSSSSTGDQPTLSNPSSPITTTADPASSNENAIQSNSKSDEPSKGNSAMAAAVSNSNPNSSANTLRSIIQNDNGQIYKSSFGGNISPHLAGLKERGIKVTIYNPQSKKNQSRCSTSSIGSMSVRDAIDETITSMIPDAQLSKQLENLSMPSLEPLEIAANPSSSEVVPVSSSPSNEPSCSPKIRVKSGEELGLNHVDGENFFNQFIVDSSMDGLAGRVADNFIHILDENIGEIAVLLKTMNQNKNSHDTRIRHLKKRMPNGPTTEIQHMEVNALKNSHRNILQHQCEEIVRRLNTCIDYISIDDLMPQIFRKFCEAMGPSVQKSNVVKTYLSILELVLNNQAYHNSELIRRIAADDFCRAAMNIDSTSTRGRKRAAPIPNFVPPPQMCENAVTPASKITCLRNNPGPAYNSTERNLAVVQSSASQNMTQGPVITNAPIFAQREIPAYRPNIPSTPRNSLPTMQNSAMNNFGETIPRMFLGSSPRPSALATPHRLDNTLRRANATDLANTYGGIIRGHENVRTMVNQPNLRVATSQGNVQLNSSNYAPSPPCYRNPPPYQQHSMGMEMNRNMMRSSDITGRPVAAEIHREIVSTTTIVRPSIPPHLSIPRHQAISARPNSPIYPNVSTCLPVSNSSIGSIHTSFPGRQNSCVYSNNFQAHQLYPNHPSNPTHPAAIPFYNPSMTPRTYSNRYPNAVSSDMNPTMLQNQRPYSPHQLTRAVSPSPIIQRNVSWNECPIQRPQYPPYIHNDSSRFQSSQPSFSRHETTPLSSLSSLSGEKPLSVQVVNSTLSPSAGPSPNLESSEMPISVPIVQSSSSPNVDQICNFEGLDNISTPFLKDSEFEELLKSNVLNMTTEGMDQGNITRENH